MNMLKNFFENVKNINFYTTCDAAEPWQLGLQDPATPVVEGMIFFHNYLMIFLIVIAVFVFWMLFYVIRNFNQEVHPRAEKFTHNSALEIVWTIIPAVILLFIAVPSFALLYSLDESIDPDVTLKVIGHQWYWSYEYSDYTTLPGGDIISFDSYMIPTSDLTKGALRLLEVDNRIVLPVNTNIRLLVTGADVLHSWAVPSFGIKIDACPGRLTQGSLFIKREGVYYGQCSEICGVNHGFMPIVVKGVSPEKYIDWVHAKLPDLEEINTTVEEKNIESIVLNDTNTNSVVVNNSDNSNRNGNENLDSNNNDSRDKMFLLMKEGRTPEEAKLIEAYIISIYKHLDFYTDQAIKDGLMSEEEIERYKSAETMMEKLYIWAEVHGRRKN
jgi:cytochrome c oxidase subunit 2